MTLETSYWVLSAAAVMLLLCIWAVRRPRRPGFGVPWVPWHGLMILSLILIILTVVNILEIWRTLSQS